MKKNISTLVTEKKTLKFLQKKNKDKKLPISGNISEENVKKSKKRKIFLISSKACIALINQIYHGFFFFKLRNPLIC